MPTAPLTGDTGGIAGTAAPTVDEQFSDLICADADLVAAEFDAIIAAEWPEPPTHRPGGRDAAGHPGSEGARGSADAVADPGSPARDPHVDRSARERSPPARQPQPHRTPDRRHNPRPTDHREDR